MITRALMCLALASAALVADDAKIDDKMACYPSVPVVVRGAPVELHAVVDSDLKAAQLVWTVAPGDGSLTSKSNGVAIWDTTGLSPGAEPYRAHVDAMLNGRSVGACNVAVLVISTGKSRSGKKDSRLGLLVSGKDEDQRFGLFSYILFSARPADDAEKMRFTEILTKAHAKMIWLNLQKDATSESDMKKLNLTSVPVMTTPLLKETASDEEWGKELLKNYDIDTSKRLLEKAGIRGGSGGVYIVSVPQPLTKVKPAAPFLKQNLSAVPGHFAGIWIALFMDQAAKPDYWNENRGYQMLAQMRILIASAAENEPAVAKSVQSLRAMIGF